MRTNETIRSENVKPYSVTIGIPAHDEERNLPFLLDSVLAQKTESFRIDRIIVICDGCTDSTAATAMRYADRVPEMTVEDDGQRIGKVRRLNRIFAMNRSDILVILDADTVLATDTSLAHLVAAIADDASVNVAVGHIVPVPPTNWIQRVNGAGLRFWQETYLSMNGGSNIHGVMGSIVAYRGTFSDAFRYPDDVTSDTGYLYIVATKEKSSGLRYVRDAVLLFRFPETLEETRRTAARSVFERHDNLSAMFGKDYVESLYAIPADVRLRSLARMLFRYPIGTVASILFGMYIRTFPEHDTLLGRGMWETTATSKSAITVPVVTDGSGAGSESSDLVCSVASALDEGLRSEWAGLWERSALGHFFNSVEFFESCLAAFGITKYRIVTCRRDGVLRSVLPLVRDRVFGIPVMTAAGRHGNYVDRPPLLLESDDRDLMNVTIHEAMRLGNVYLPEVHETALPSLEGADHMLMATEPVSVNRQADLSPELDTLRYMSSRQKRKIRSLGRSEADFSLRIFDASPEAGLATVLEIERKSSKPRRHMALFGRREARKLFESIVRIAPRFLSIAVLYDGDRPVATSMGFVWKGVYAGYHSAFDETYGRFSPGKELVYRLLESLKSEGYRKVDFLRGDSSLKKDFASDTYTQYDVLISDRDSVLAYWKVAFRIRNLLKQAVHVARHAERSLSGIFVRRHGKA